METLEEKTNPPLEKFYPPLARMVSEAYRLRAAAGNAYPALVPSAQKKFLNAIARFDKQFFAAAGAAGLAVVDFAGAKYEEGLPISPINLMDVPPEAEAVVAATLEPTIKLKDSDEILQRGSVVLAPLPNAKVEEKGEEK